jgi:chromate transport protein ChrA
VKVCGFFLPLGEGELIDKLFNTHEGKKMFLSLLAIVICFVLFFFFWVQTLCLVLVFFVWVEFVLVGERKKKRKRKKRKEKSTEQAVEGKGGVKMVWLRMY